MRVSRLSGSASATVGAVIVAAVSAIQFCSAAPLDPEPYHDGSQVAPAIAVAEGLIIHRQVFDPYGPVTAWLQGLAMTIFGPTVLTARLLTAVLLVMSSVLMFLIARHLIGRTLYASLITVLWIAIWPGQSISWGTPLLPWPSVTFLVLQLSAVLLLLQRLRASEPDLLRMGGVGVFVGLSLLTRPNYGVPLLIAVGLVLLLVRRSAGLSRGEFSTAAGGLLLSVGIPLLYLALNGALVAFLDQALIGPLTGESDATSHGTPWFYIKNAYLWGSVPLLLALVGLVILERSGVRGRWLIRTAGVLVVGGLLVWTSSGIEGSPVRDLILSKLTWSPALDGQVAQPMFVAAIFAILTAAATGVALVVRAVSRQRTWTAPQRMFTLLVAASAASLVQLYPIADPNHLWWAVPLPLVLVALMLTTNANKQVAFWLMMILTVPYLAMSIWSAHGFYSRPRVELSTGVLKGMMVQEALLPDYEKVDGLLAGVTPRSARFLCDQGLFSVWNGAYLADSPAYVQWVHRMQSADPSPVPNLVFLCTGLDAGDAATDYARREGLAIVQTIPRLGLSYFTSIRIDEMSPDPMSKGTVVP